MNLNFDHGDYFRVPNQALKLGKDIDTYVCLLRYADTEKLTCYPSLKRLTADTKKSRATIARSIQRLKQMNVISVEQRFKAGRQTTNIYAFTDPSVWRLDAVNEQSEPLAMPEPEPIPKSKPAKSERLPCLECGQRYFKGHNDSTGVCGWCEDPRVKSGEITRYEGELNTQ